MTHKKTIFAIISSLALGASVVACSNVESKKSLENTHVVVASVGADAQIWKYIAQSAEAKQAGLDIEVKEINDGVALNRAVIDQDADVNAFQSWGYFKAFNQIHGEQLVAISTTYLEPMGLYSSKYKTLNDLPHAAKVAIPNDAANTARALRLLEQAKLIQLDSHFNAIRGNLKDITANPKKLKIELIKGPSGPRVLPDVDLVAIGNTDALDSGLNVLQQSLARENVGERTTQNINILVVNKARANDANLAKLGKLYHQPFVAQYIQKHFGGTKVDVDQPISSLN